ncbi:hypothetical protein LJR225_001649 [Phenylobacterium sp. LjRoot225]|uniref:hypothetical protein n=1 Tax=Phenylobacterium sp. LjRoot225 TaxID=3342285 RepID=UPI003ED0A6E2
MRQVRNSGEARRWLAAAVLMVSAYLTGPALAASLCYWNGRLQAGRLPFALPAYGPADAPFVLAVSTAALAWLVLWLLFARAQRWRRFGRLLAAAPLALFCWAAWRAAASCTAF